MNYLLFNRGQVSLTLIFTCIHTVTDIEIEPLKNILQIAEI